mmetsp:Transcript_32095/g.63887  ORF Transcript_32095/g.63887 Transcript_32095/m.63887 type:complete len:101 (+) Transcript_32095:232-534(+)
MNPVASYFFLKRFVFPSTAPSIKSRHLLYIICPDDILTLLAQNVSPISRVQTPSVTQRPILHSVQLRSNTSTLAQNSSILFPPFTRQNLFLHALMLNFKS